MTPMAEIPTDKKAARVAWSDHAEACARRKEKDRAGERGGPATMSKKGKPDAGDVRNVNFLA